MMGHRADVTPGLGEGFVPGFVMGVCCALTMGGLIALGILVLAW